MMSTGVLMMAVGSAAAMSCGETAFGSRTPGRRHQLPRCKQRSSMEVPPVLLPIISGPPLARSMRMAKYFS